MKSSPLLIPFSKYHALGNDYLVMDPQKIALSRPLSTREIQLICHRNFGIGSDGILWGPILETGKPFRVQIFNPDGSEAEKSGNGVRIFSQYLKDNDYVRENFMLQTLGGQVRVEFLEGPKALIRVDMGPVTFQTPPKPLLPEPFKDENYQITCVSIGNPHCVILMKEISEALAKQLGPHVENHPQFPNRINMQLLKVLDRKNIQIEIWERGAGYTLASGSSSCAAASAAYHLGLVDSSLTVHMPGGQIGIDRTPEGTVLMTGPVTRVAVGELDSHYLTAL